jgi:hypothetical protein
VLMFAKTVRSLAQPDRRRHANKGRSPDPVK